MLFLAQAIDSKWKGVFTQICRWKASIGCPWNAIGSRHPVQPIRFDTLVISNIQYLAMSAMWTMVALSLLVSVSPVAAETRAHLEDGYLLLQKNKERTAVWSRKVSLPPPPPPAPIPLPGGAGIIEPDEEHSFL